MLPVLVLSLYCALLLPTYAQNLTTTNRVGRGIGPDLGWQSTQIYRDAALAPNATGNFTGNTYAYSTGNTQAILIDPYNATSLYAVALSLNATLVGSFNAAYNTSTLNQVLEVTVSETNIQRMASQNRSLHVIFFASYLPATHNESDGSCTALLGGDCAAALAQGYNNYTGSDYEAPGQIASCAGSASSNSLFSTFALPLSSFFSSSPNLTASNPDSAGFYNETYGTTNEPIIATRFNHSGFGHGLDFATRSALFYATSVVGTPSNYSVYDTTLDRVNLVVVQERLADGSFNNSNPSWTSLHCIRANMTLNGSRRPSVISGTPTSGTTKTSRSMSMWAALPLAGALTLFL